MNRISVLLAGLATLAVVAFAAPVRAEEGSYALTLKDHKFAPDTIEIPANQKVRLVVKNEDPTAEEFDSDDLHREKVIAGGKEGIVNIGPLKPGTYKFVGEYHSATAKGRIIAK